VAYLLIPLRQVGPPTVQRLDLSTPPPPAVVVDPLADWMRVATASADACLVAAGRGRVAAV